MVSEERRALHPVQMLRSVGVSILINGLGPFLIYSYFEPHFPKDSVQPLLYASVLPVFWLVFGIARNRMVDTIALIALLAISVNISAIFLTPSPKWALVARSLNGVFTATLFLVSTLIGKPLFYYVARQFVMANDPASIDGFDAANAADGKRTFSIVTLVWAIGVYSLCALNVTLALTMAPASYLLVSQITTTTAIIALTVWTIRFTRTRLTPSTVSK
jgi:hypothetical protein